MSAGSPSPRTELVPASVRPAYPPAVLYLDHAATTPMRPEVWDAMAPFVDDAYGNPSGLHAVSQRAKNALEEAREEVAHLIGARPQEIVFTGGGTESDNLAIKGRVLRGDITGGVVTVATEHEAVLESAEFVAKLGAPLAIVGVDRQGRVDPEELADAVDETTAVVSVMTANNETGAVQPIRETVAAVRRKSDVPVHTDAVQAFVSEPLLVDDLGIDLLTLAAHKFGGPKGVGLLYVRTGIELEPALHGGGQEMGRRSGTHNVAGTVGMATAMRLADDDRHRFRSTVAAERDDFESALFGTIPGLMITSTEHRLIQHSHIRIPGHRNETMLIRLDQAGVAAAAGSACQSGALDTSHVLEAMGFSAEEAQESYRFTFGWTTRPGDGKAAAAEVLHQVTT